MHARITGYPPSLSWHVFDGQDPAPIESGHGFRHSNTAIDDLLRNYPAASLEYVTGYADRRACIERGLRYVRDRSKPIRERAQDVLAAVKSGEVADADGLLRAMRWMREG